jgi:DNA-binding response OmpR family regulator
VLRRVNATPTDSRPQALTFGAVRVDPNTRQVLVQGREVSLTVKEFDLLWTLATHPRQVFNRDQLLDLVWGVTEYVDPSTVTVHVRRLREKIEADPSEPQHIQTIWGVGYRFDP